MRQDLEKVTELLAGGNRKNVDRALELIQNTVFNFSMKVCGHRQDAEDTMQEVLVKSLPYLPQFSSPKALSVWLYTVARNRCLMSRRRSTFAPKETLSLDELMPDRDELEQLMASPIPSPEAAALEGERVVLLRRAIDKLPPEYRMVLVMHDMEEVPANEIAEVLGVRPVTVRVRLHRARLFLRREMTAQGKKRTKERKPTRCKRVFAMLSEYLDDALPPDACRELDSHIGGCKPCEAFLDDLERTVKQCRRFCPDGKNEKKAAELRKKLREQLAKVSSR